MKTSKRIFSLRVPTEDGVFTAVYSQTGLRELSFPGGKAAKVFEPASDIPQQVQQWHSLTCQAVERLLAGRPPSRLPPLDLSAGTEFQRQVWAAMRAIPFGKTVSYQGIAQSIGNPKACRAVGGACGANPIPVLIPCHRVLAAKQRLGGFSGGLDWKIKLLAREGSWTPAPKQTAPKRP
jgi:O-6-methylguanine DNA methyltransferase